MASTVKWELSLEEVEIGKEITLTAMGLDAHEGMVVLIDLPNRSVFQWGVQADEFGRVRESIKLDSGLGQYTFCPRPTCGNVVPHCRTINVCPCGTAKTGCDVKITGPDKIVAGHPTTFIVSGLRPSWACSLKLASNEFSTAFFDRVSDVEGELHFELDWRLAGTYALTASDGSCISPPLILNVVNSLNESPVIASTDANPCSYAIDISTTFSKANYRPTESGVLHVSACNRGPEYREITISSFLDLSGATITSMAIPSVITLSGYECKEYNTLFATSASDGVLSAQLSGSYICHGNIYAANGSASNATVGKGSGYCAAMLQALVLHEPKTSYAVDEEISIDVIIFNSGNVPISNAYVLSANLPENVGFTGPMSSLTNIAPGTSQTLTFKVKASAAGNYTIQIPGNKITYSCGGTQVPIGTTGYVSFVVS